MTQSIMKKRAKKRVDIKNDSAKYNDILADVSKLLEEARRTVSRAVNAVMTTTYWEIGRRIVVEEQCGKERADYGERIIESLADGLTQRFGRGFSRRNLAQMRLFYLERPILQTASAKSGTQGPTPSFPLSWSHYVRLLGVQDEAGRRFYEAEALRSGWTVRQLNRQIGSQFYERTMPSRNKAKMLENGTRKKPEDRVTAEEEIKDPFVLEFLNLKDEYSETELEDALITHVSSFLMELGRDFTFVGRQQRLRVDDTWCRVDLVLYHRKLRCLILIDLKLDNFTYADAGQMHMYLNYAREHWTNPGENPPVGLILCTGKGKAMAKYALDGLSNKVLAATYRTNLPSVVELEREVNKTAKELTERIRIGKG